MIHGLLWLPLLAIFGGLAWAGWNEYRKLEGYKVWAQQFERAKYDIYAALGQQGSSLTWGVPTRQGILQTQRVDLNTVEKAQLEVDSKPVMPDNLPTRGRFTLGLTLKNGDHISVPFTDGEMACQWLSFLQREWKL